MTQTGPANEGCGFHEGAGGVSEQDPVDREVDGRFEAGAIEVNVIKIDWSFEANVDGAGGSISASEQGNEACIDRSQNIFIDDVGEAITGAFGEGFDSFDPTDLEEPLKQLTVSETDAEITVVELCDAACNVTAQGEDTVAGDELKAFRANVFKVITTMLDAEIDEFVFQARGDEEFVDANEKLACFAVFFTAINFR